MILSIFVTFKFNKAIYRTSTSSLNLCLNSTNLSTALLPVIATLGGKVIKIAAIHISVPVIFALAVGVIGSQKELNDLFVAIFGGALFYCTPHLCWLGFHLLAKPGHKVLHSGYTGATLALILIASLWLLPPDQSGLPIQWLAYWPFAAILIILFSGVTYLFAKLRSS